jgi:cytoskeletal protein CcmA (bactofilin family)
MHERERGRTASEDGSGSSAFLGKGSRIVGKLSFEGPARIEGNVEGEILAQDTLTIGEGAVVNAQITGSAVIIHGRVTGDVTARKRLEIRAPGRLIGNIATPNLVIHEGVVFEGQCAMGGETRATEKERKVTLVFPQADRDGDTSDAPRAVADSAK